MSLARGAQAHHEPQRARWQSALVGVLDDGRVEERGAFERVFAGEVRADQQPALAVGGVVGQAERGDHLVMGLEEVLRARVPAAELLHDPVQPVGDLRVGEREDAADNLGHALVVAGQKGPQEHARAVGQELDAGAFDGGKGGRRHAS